MNYNKKLSNLLTNIYQEIDSKCQEANAILDIHILYVIENPSWNNISRNKWFTNLMMDWSHKHNKPMSMEFELTPNLDGIVRTKNITLYKNNEIQK